MKKIEVIFGPPGTGKTSEIVKRVKKHLDKNYLFCSFTRAAAKEGLERIGGEEDRARTIHSIAYEQVGVTKEQVVDDAKLREFARVTGYPMACVEIDKEAGLLGDELLTFVQLSEARMETLIETYNNLRPQISFNIIRNFSMSYHNWKKKWGYIDFNDMLKKFTEVGMVSVDSLFIDEAQDLSPLQWAAINHIEADYTCIVGDDDQAIYAWNGADPQGMVRFAEKHGAEVLTKSHRLPEEIWAVSEGIVDRIKNRHHKMYRPADKHGKIYHHGNVNGIKLEDGDSLFLYRNHSVRWMLEEYLIKRDIPYLARGTGFFDNRYAKLVRNYLKAVAHGDIEKFRSKMYPAVKSAPASKIMAMPWWSVVRVPMEQIQYLRRVDLDAVPKVRLSTIHGSKGLEADQVVLLTAMGNQTWETMSMDPDSEHRVWYVGVTRARKTLHLVQGGLDYVV